MNFFKPDDQNVSAKTDVKLSGTYTFLLTDRYKSSLQELTPKKNSVILLPGSSRT